MEIVYVVVCRLDLEGEWVVAGVSAMADTAAKMVHSIERIGDDALCLWLQVPTNWRPPDYYGPYTALMSYLKSGGQVEDVTPWN